MLPEVIILPILWFLDMLFTYLNFKMMLIIHPKLKYEDYEMNRIIVWFWKKFGFNKGTFFAGLYTFILLILVLFVVGNEVKFIWFLFGLYSIVFYMHLYSYLLLVVELKKRRNKKCHIKKS